MHGIPLLYSQNVGSFAWRFPGREVLGTLRSQAIATHGIDLPARLHAGLFTAYQYVWNYSRQINYLQLVASETHYRAE